MTVLCNSIVEAGKIPNDWKKSWMVNVYNVKEVALECVIKLLLFILFIYLNVKHTYK